MSRAATAGWLFLCLLATPAVVLAQHSDSSAPSQSQSAGLFLPDAPAAKLDPTESPHRFWDRENGLLFAGVTGTRALDYFSTLNMRSRGRQEILLSDWVVDNHGLFVGIEASGVALSVGAAYAFHRTGHHKLERWVSIVHIGVGTGGAIRNYCLKTAHVAP